MVLDDVEMVGSGAAIKARLKNNATLMRYVSSHKSFSVMVCHQDCFSLQPIVKKTADIHDMAAYGPQRMRTDRQPRRPS
jgi:hypothetical protein